MRSSLYSLAGSAATALAATRGFNYGSQGNSLDTFTNQFESAQAVTDYASARLYTMIQEGTANTVISAIPAAIKTNTTLLLGLWASENQDAFNNELTALKTAISQFGSQGLADLTVGISVGSEDLYRITPTGIKQKSGVGQSVDVLIDYIKQVREAVKGTALANVPIGHVDTWNAFTNSSNAAILGAVDFLGLDEYPFYQDGQGNSIDNAASLFWDAYNAVEAVAGGTPLWVTETGWPISGKTEDQAVPSLDNAAKYWQDIACELESRCINFWWYILNDQGASPSFSVAGSLEGANTKPLFDLKCKNASKCGSTVSGKNSLSSSSVSFSASASAGSTRSASVKVNAAGATGTGAVASVTAVTTSYVTTCPAGAVITNSGKETTLTAPSVITTSGVVSQTITAGGAFASGAGASGVAGGAQASGTGLASSWAANQTPGSSATASSGAVYTGAASKVGGSAAVVLGAAAAAAALM